MCTRVQVETELVRTFPKRLTQVLRVRFWAELEALWRGDTGVLSFYHWITALSHHVSLCQDRNEIGNYRI